MANFDLLTAQNLLLDDVPGIVEFARRQNALKEEAEKEREKKETEAALKMSMEAGQEDEESRNISIISVDEFKAQTKAFV